MAVFRSNVGLGVTFATQRTRPDVCALPKEEARQQSARIQITFAAAASTTISEELNFLANHSANELHDLLGNVLRFRIHRQVVVVVAEVPMR